MSLSLASSRALPTTATAPWTPCRRTPTPPHANMWYMKTLSWTSAARLEALLCAVAASTANVIDLWQARGARERQSQTAPCTQRCGKSWQRSSWKTAVHAHLLPRLTALRAPPRLGRQPRTPRHLSRRALHLQRRRKSGDCRLSSRRWMRPRLLTGSCRGRYRQSSNV